MCLTPYTREGRCPMADCPKNMLNGPCGGVHDGLCELGDRPCVWVGILAEMRKQDKIDEFMQIRLPKIK